MSARKLSQRTAALLTALLASAGLAASTPAEAQLAQDEIALGRFHPAPAGDRFFGVPSPYAAGHLDLHVMAVGDYAHNPLVLRVEGGDEDEDLGAIVEHQLFVHLNVSFALWHRLMINVDMPAAVFQSGESPSSLEGTAISSPDSAELGDLRAGLRLRIVGEYHDPFQLGVGGYVWFPTGGSDSYVSDGTVRGQPQLLLGGRADRFIWSLAGGPEFRSSTTFANVEQGHRLHWGAGLGVLLGELRRFQIGAEVSGSNDLENVAARSTNAEILGGIKWRFVRDFELGLAAGPGLTNGIGTPDVRGVLTIAYTPEIPPPSKDRDKDGIMDEEDACIDTPGVRSDDPKKNGCPPSDRDKDGILDEVDACPDKPGKPNADPKKNGCPEVDTDGDGIFDDKDACPTEKGEPNEDPKKHGCPPPPPEPDKDGDGVPDSKDACPDIPGVKTEDPKTNGCPPDTDGDGFRDDQDACPKDKGPDDPDPKKRGCPKVRVTETEVVILEQVQFDTGRATIKKASDELLDNVAKVLKDNPQLKKVEVQGHTDNVGTKPFNQKLSQARAESVRAALVKRGVEATRLTPKGYGQDKPIGDNSTDEGRQQNRRVQFVITEQEKKTAPETPATPATPAPAGKPAPSKVPGGL